MAYESRFIIGVSHDNEGTKERPRRWVKVLADFDMGKITYNAEFHEDLLTRSTEDKGYFFYARDIDWDNGQEDFEVRRDHYSGYLMELDIEEVLEVLTKDFNEKRTGKGEVAAFLAALQMFVNFKEQYEIPELGRRLILLHYGH